MNRGFCVIAVLIGISILSFGFVKKNPAPSIARTLNFPVWGKRAWVGSFWGAARDGGKRKHEGIDIFARKGTPVVAITDGIIVSKGNTPRGGKTLWLRALGKPWTVYYAHLDQQKVKRGQFVKKGQIIGTVGNTGNARYTPPHLHFGIYTWTGAINPLPYVKTSPRVVTPYGVKKPAPVVAKKKKAS
jgi:murein DD-endopeptidase MepM/ murein hydrolase activator NlpD